MTIADQTASASDIAVHGLMQAKRLMLGSHVAAEHSHELNNLLGKIIGLAEMSIDQILDRPDVCGDLEALIAVAEQGAALVGRLQAFGYAPIADPRPFDLAVLAAKACAAAQTRHHATFHCATPATPCMVLADYDLIRIALDSVLDNAAQWGASRVHLSCQQRADPTGETAAEVAVFDNGIGLEPGIIDRVFDAFFTTHPAGDASGMGLTLAKSAVSTCGGRVEISLLSGGGTAVRLIIPMQQ